MTFLWVWLAFNAGIVVGAWWASRPPLDRCEFGHSMWTRNGYTMCRKHGQNDGYRSP